MSRARLAVMIAVPSITLAIVAACTGEDPDLGGAVDGGPSTSDTSIGPGADGASGGDSGLACAIDTADCDLDPTNGCETNIKTSPAHCGTCGHACGGSATCTAGVCDVEKLKDGLDHPFGLELSGARLMWFAGDGSHVDGCRIDDCATSAARLAEIEPSPLAQNVDLSPRQMYATGGLFYVAQCAQGDCALHSCPITGCKNDGTKPVSPNTYGLRRPSELVGGAGGVYWWYGADGLTRHDLGDGGITFLASSYQIVDYLRGFYVDATRVIYVDDNASTASGTGGVYTCAATGCVGSRKLLVGPPVRNLAVGGGRAITATGGPNAGTGSVTSCDYVDGCNLAGDVLATNQAYVRDLAADDAAVYWITSGNQDVKTGAGSTGTVMRCAQPKCAGGPTKIADAQANPVSIRLDADYVYWMTFGTPNQMNGAVHRRRR